MISVIIPAFREEKMIRQTAETIAGILQREAIPYELLFIDDGSTDATWQEIQEASARDNNVRGIHFSRDRCTPLCRKKLLRPDQPGGGLGYVLRV